MSKRMNKDKAKEELRDRKILAEIEYNQSEDAKKKDNLLRYIQALDIVIDSLDNEWVDVRDRLPSESKQVLVTLLSGKVDVLSLVNIEKYEKERNAKVGNPENFTYFWNTTAYWYKFNEVIAWKPLPEPYERKE